MKKDVRAMLQMVLCAVLWSSSGVLIKLLPWHPMVIAAIRSIVTALVLITYMAFTKTRFMINKKTLLLASTITLIFCLYLPATKLTTSANAVVLQYTAPVYILLFGAIIHKQPIRRGDVVAVCVTIAGMALFFFDQLGGGALLGNILGLISGIFLAGMFFITPLLTEEERMSGILTGQALTCMIGIPFLLVHGAAFSPQSLLTIALLGIFQLGIPYLLYTAAARHCSGLSCSLIGTLEPLLNPVWVFFAIGEQPGIFALFGGIVVLCSITIWSVWNEKRKTIRPVTNQPAASCARQADIME